MKQTNTNHMFLRLPRSIRNFHLRAVAKSSVALITLMAFCQATVAAPPPANASIGNQASATYEDPNGNPRTATSNPVVTTVQQIGAIDLQDPRSILGSPGSPITYSHTVYNNGNGADTFNLAIVQSGADNFDLTGVVMYADTDNDGNPDDLNPITATPQIAAGSSYTFIIVGTVPGSALSGHQSILTVTATSQFDGTKTDSNIDTVTVTANAVVNVTKQIDDNDGYSPSGPYTYTLTFVNNGNNSATNITLVDTIPAGMTYVSNSARWSGSGATVLGDGAGGDPAGIDYNYDLNAAGAVWASVARLVPGQSGTLTFQVNVNSGLAPQTINNRAYSGYNDGSGTIITNQVTPNVPFNVLPLYAIGMKGMTITNAIQGATLFFTNVVTNLGNMVDTFNITYQSDNFPAGSTYQFLKSDAASGLTDSGIDGIADTGPMNPLATYDVVVRVTLPANATGGPYTLTKRGTSVGGGAGVFTNVNDVLSLISTNSVDLKNDGDGALGLGYGPETAAVKTNAVNPGATTRFTLYIKNTSLVSDSFDLAVSTDSSFASIALPAGWTIAFVDGANAPVANTGVLAAGAGITVYADITVPANAAPVNQSIYFRAKSPTSSAQDRKHDMVVVNTIRSLTITPNNSGQIFPGGAVFYSHIIRNTGNVIEGDGTASTITLSEVNSLVAQGWTATIYNDANGNGSLDPGDTNIVTLNYTGGLAPNGTTAIIVKVQSPAGAPIGAINGTTISATTSQGTYSVAAPAVATALDNTTVIASELVLTKEQALDANCDGTPDGAWVSTPLSALPGGCIMYRIVARNQGTTNAVSVVVTDQIPSYTQYTNSPAAATSKLLGTAVYSPVPPAKVTFTIGTVTPGERVTNSFSVQIDQ